VLGCPNGDTERRLGNLLIMDMLNLAYIVLAHENQVMNASRFWTNLINRYPDIQLQEHLPPTWITNFSSYEAWLSLRPLNRIHVTDAASATNSSINDETEQLAFDGETGVPDLNQWALDMWDGMSARMQGPYEREIRRAVQEVEYRNGLQLLQRQQPLVQGPQPPPAPSASSSSTMRPPHAATGNEPLRERPQEDVDNTRNMRRSHTWARREAPQSIPEEDHTPGH
jgi:hypothetical protein